MSEEFKENFNQYGQSLIDGDANATVDFVYPKLFNYVPKEAILNSLKAGQNNPSVKISFSDFQIISVENKLEIDSKSYILVTSASKMVMAYAPVSKKIKNENSLDGDEAEFTYEMLVEKYGQENVVYEKDSRVIRANAISKLLGIREGGKWYFLDVKVQLIDLYEQFLPGEVVRQLTMLFPAEVERVPVEPPSKKTKKKKVSKSDIVEEGNIKRMFLAGWEVHLNGDELCENFLATQITTKETVEKLYAGIELVFEENKLVKAYDYREGKKEERPLQDDEIGLAYHEFPVNKIYQMNESSRGKHQLGGEVPKGFKLPESNAIVPFQYLGYISNEDPTFKWLPFVVHLTCPIYLNITNVFLDYADPMHPTIINVAEVESADTSYDELNKESEIVFEAAKFSFDEDVTFSSAGHAGVPNWIQYPDIPVCPKSGKRMRFLAQFHAGVQASRSNVEPADEFYRHYFEELNFWGDGDLFIFFEPSSKVGCYFIQNT